MLLRCSLFAAPKIKTTKRSSKQEIKTSPKARLVIQYVRVIHIYTYTSSFRTNAGTSIKSNRGGSSTGHGATQWKHGAPTTHECRHRQRSIYTYFGLLYVRRNVRYLRTSSRRQPIKNCCRTALAPRKTWWSIFLVHTRTRKKEEKLLTRPPQTKCTYIVRTSLTTLGCFVPRK